MSRADAAQVLLDNARAQLDRESQLLDVVKALNGEIGQLYHEIAELRDELLALSNRIEAATRSAVTGGTLLHSVKVYEHRPHHAPAYCFKCERRRWFTEGKCDHCATPLQAEAEPS